MRDSSADAFGRGRKRAMSFGQFLDAVAEGDDKLYLTTQQVWATGVWHEYVAVPYGEL